MKKAFFIGLIISMLIADFAALDDITTGNEKSYILESMFLFFSAAVFFVMGILFFLKKKAK